MSSLPPGVTDSMCDGVISHCGNCGHTSEFHYEEEDLIYTPNGEKICCDHKGCSCVGFGDFEYEPDYDDYRSDLD